MKNFSRRYGSDLQNGERLILSFFLSVSLFCRQKLYFYSNKYEIFLDIDVDACDRSCSGTGSSLHR